LGETWVLPRWRCASLAIFARTAFRIASSAPDVLPLSLL